MDRSNRGCCGGRQRLAPSIAAVCLAGLGALSGAVVGAQTTGGLIGFGGQRWQTDHGVRAGRCDRGAILTQSAGQRDLVAEHQQHLKNRTVGIIGSAQSGVLLSTRTVGRHGSRFDAADRACVGHVLELGTVGREVSWLNSGTQLAYVVVLEAGSVASSANANTNANGSANRCRVLLLATVPARRDGSLAGGGAQALKNAERLIACQSSPGVWAFK